MLSSRFVALLATAFLALTATASPTNTNTLRARADEAAEVCGDFLLASTPMCCNQDPESEDGLDCKEASKIKDVEAFKEGCKDLEANCCATALGSGALVCQKVV